MSQVAVGDTNRAGSEAKLTVGALQCHGDREFISLNIFKCSLNALKHILLCESVRIFLIGLETSYFIFHFFILDENHFYRAAAEKNE